MNTGMDPVSIMKSNDLHAWWSEVYVHKYIEFGYSKVYDIELTVLHPSPTLVDINTSIYQEDFWF